MRVWSVLVVVAVAAIGVVPGRGACARDLVVGVEAIDYASLYAYRDGRYSGAAREIIDAFAEASGHHVVYRAFPVRRLLAELVHGGIDLKFPDNPGWQPSARQGASIAYSMPVIGYVDGTVVRQDHRARDADSVTSLGTIAGFTPVPWGDRLNAGTVELKENPNFEQLLRQLQAGRIDAAYANVAVALNLADSMPGGAGTLVFAPQLPHVRDSYRLSSVNSPEVIAEFDQWLARNGKLVADIIARTGAERGLR